MQPVRAGLAIAAGAILLTGCTDTNGVTHRSAAAHPSNAASVPAPKPTMEAAVGDTDLKTIKFIRPRAGNMEMDVNVQQKSVFLALTCLGAGTLSVNAGAIGSFSIPCASDKVNRTFNEVTLKRVRAFTVAVATTPNVTWSLRVQQ